ncbi:MAG TPA: DUF922 domain-containing protein [Chitinophagaceae bacterium]|nr:DUF922 domain-containing protein [Chitinophagaceae bacterium]
MKFQESPGVKVGGMNRIRMILLAAWALPVLAVAQPAGTAGSANGEPGETGNYIAWSSARRLQWSDYRGRPDPRSDAAASTSTEIGFEYRIRNGVPSYTLFCHFSPSRSWGRYRTSYILAHEQGHFDITEIFARRLFQALKETPFHEGSFRRDVERLYTSIMQDREHMQQAYDQQTDYSRNQVQQEAWLKKIGDMLHQTETYAGYAQNSP